MLHSLSTSHGVQMILSVNFADQLLLSGLRITALTATRPLGVPKRRSSALDTLPSQIALVETESWLGTDVAVLLEQYGLDAVNFIRTDHETRDQPSSVERSKVASVGSVATRTWQCGSTALHLRNHHALTGQICFLRTTCVLWVVHCTVRMHGLVVTERSH